MPRREVVIMFNRAKCPQPFTMMKVVKSPKKTARQANRLRIGLAIITLGLALSYLASMYW